MKEFLEAKYHQYNNPGFISSDPISIPHLFSKKEDIEIAAFLAATIAWGQRATIIKNAKKLVEWMDLSPHSFIMEATENDLKPFHKFVHRTFNGIDCVCFIHALRHVYKNDSGLEGIFQTPAQAGNSKESIISAREKFFSSFPATRTLKHFSNPASGSAAKRINMFLRWMVRKDNMGVDFGIWSGIKPGQLVCPLDVHSGNVARKLGLLTRKQNDWKAVEELTDKLKTFDPEDPAKYDFALFGLGVFERF